MMEMKIRSIASKVTEGETEIVHIFMLIWQVFGIVFKEEEKDKGRDKNGISTQREIVPTEI